MSPPARADRYEIRMRGVLDARWSARFAGLRVRSDAAGGETLLSGVLPDQAALHGALPNQFSVLAVVHTCTPSAIPCAA